MKVKDVLRDLGPTTLVQIYTLIDGVYKKCFIEEYTMEIIISSKYINKFGRYFDKEIDHADFEHHYTTNDMIASCNIYLKAEQNVNEKKLSSIDYSDLEKKWTIFREEMMITDDCEVKAWLISSFLHRLSEGTLIEMEDKDLS